MSEHLKKYPLTHPQKRIWYSEKIHPDTPMHNLVGFAKYHSKLDFQILEKAFNLLIMHHDATRIRLIEDKDANISQVFSEHIPFHVEIFDFCDFPDPESEFTRWLDQEKEIAFDLEEERLYRIKFFKLSQKEMGYFVNFHHIISDGWSFQLLVKYISNSYDSISKGGGGISGDTPSYKEFIQHEAEYLKSNRSEKNKEFWFQKFTDYALEKSPTDTFNTTSKQANFFFSPASSKSLNDLIHTLGVSLNTLFVSIAYIFFSEYQHNPQPIFGIPILNRFGIQKECFGMFTSTMPFTIAPPPLLDFSSFIKLINHDLRLSLVHQKYPYDLLVQELKLNQHGITSLFDICINYYNTSLEDVSRINQEPAEIKELFTGHQVFPLYIIIKEWHITKEIEININYKDDIYTDEYINNMFKIFKTIINSIVTNPNILIPEILNGEVHQKINTETSKQKKKTTDLTINLTHDFSSEQPFKQNSVKDTTANDANLIKGFNNTANDYPLEKTMIDYFEDQSKNNPDRLCIITSEKSYSYQEVNLKANQLARILRVNGVTSNTIVPIMVERSYEMIIGILAIHKAGGAYLPIDISFPISRIEFILIDSNAELMLSTKNVIANNNLPIKKIFLDDDQSYAQDNTDLPRFHKSKDLAYVIYTSGSTGNPKGVMIEHTSVVNRLLWMQKSYPISHDDIILQKTPFTFDVSVWELFWWSIVGAKLCLLDHGDEKNPQKILAAIKEYGITVIHFVPSMLSAFLSYIEITETYDQLSSLTYIFASGEELLSHQLDAFNHLINFHHKTQLINLYGPTEATVDVTYHTCTENIQDNRIPIGKPIDNTRIYIVDPDCKLLPIGGIGELCIAGVGLARGYLNNQSLTEEKFVTNPFEPEGKLYKTGDLARWLPNGEIEYLGRNDNQIKIRGFRIELDEIENILRKHTAVKDAIVLALDDTEMKSASKYLCAYIIFKQQFDVSQMSSYLDEFLPEYMVPQYYIELDSFPTTLNGKLDRKALPTPDRIQSTEGYVPPSTPLEKELADIWAQVLRVDNVGVHDNFFSLGGDSIKFITILTKTKISGYEFTFQQLFMNPTIYKLAKIIAPHDIHDCPNGNNPFTLLSKEDIDILPPFAEDAYPLSMLQAGLIFESELSKGSTMYHDVFSYRISGTFHPTIFARAVSELVRIHPILRTTYHLKEFSEYLQIVHSDNQNILSITDLSVYPHEHQQPFVDEYIENTRNTHFDWKEPGLVRIHILILNNDEYIYIVSFHDSALDGWSVNALHTELFRIYYTLLEKKELSTSENDLKFQTFIDLERKALSSIENKNYWLEKLKNHTNVKILNWPLINENVNHARVSYFEVDLPNELSNSLKRISYSLGVPLKSVLLACHLLVLSVLSGQSDVITGYEYNGRPEDIDGDRILGLFLNTIPFRVILNEGTWEDLIHQVYESELEFIPYRRYPMAQIKRDQGVTNPLFETVFNYTHFHNLKDLQELSGFNLTEVKMETDTEFPFRAEFSLNPFSEKIVLWIHYHSRKYPLEQIKQISDYYINALLNIAENPKAIYNDQSLLSTTEIDKQLNQFNDNVCKIPEESFLSLFERQVSMTPSHIAINHEDGVWSYRELNTNANLIANFLINNEIQHEEIIGLVTDRNTQWTSAIIGILKAGGVYLPIDPNHPTERVRDILVSSCCNRILCSNNYLKSINEIIQGITNTQSNINLISLDDVLSHEQKHNNPELLIDPNQLAYVIYTSGSTGIPKGVMIEHKGMLNHLYAKINELNLQQNDCIAQTASQCFDISIWQLLAGLCVGAKISIYSNEMTLEIDKFLERVNTDQVSVLEVVPSYMDVFLHFYELSDKKFQFLRTLLVTGEAVSRNLVQKWFQLTKDIRLINAYGPTEASDDITHFIMDEPPSLPIIPVGKPIHNTKIYVLDNNQRLVPIGSTGEVYVSSIGVGRGYINNAEKTRDVFLHDPFHNSGSTRLYKTGDIGRWLPDGNLELIGRIDQQVKIRGYRIEIGDIEKQLSEIAGILTNAVIVNSIEEPTSLIAFIVYQGEFNSDKIKLSLRERIPDYMIPTRIIRLEEMPLTSNGKIDKKALRHLLNSIPTQNDPITPLQNEIEIEVGKIWAEVLNIGFDTLHSSSNFFDLGGHSLKALEVSVKSDGLITLNDQFQYPVLRELATIIATRPSEETTSLLFKFTNNPHAKYSLIGVTYAGGNAINFMDLFQELDSLTSQIECYAIELPGHEYGNYESYKNFVDIADQCLKEINTNIQQPIIIWGHCSGSALALHLADILEKNNHSVERLYIGGKILDGSIQTFLKKMLIKLLKPYFPVSVDRMNHYQIKRWLIDKTNFTDFEGIDDDFSQQITASFRNDAHNANEFFNNCYASWNKHHLKAPITNVVSNNDSLTFHHQTKYRNWNLFSNSVSLEVINGGGHYFIKTKAKEIARLILHHCAINESVIDPEV